jgi:hypothetical protein
MPETGQSCGPGVRVVPQLDCNVNLSAENTRSLNRQFAGGYSAIAILRVLPRSSAKFGVLQWSWFFTSA